MSFINEKKTLINKYKLVINEIMKKKKKKIGSRLFHSANHPAVNAWRYLFCSIINKCIVYIKYLIYLAMISIKFFKIITFTNAF